LKIETKDEICEMPPFLNQTVPLATKKVIIEIMIKKMIMDFARSTYLET
jgi:hypothetical protein